MRFAERVVVTPSNASSSTLYRADATNGSAAVVDDQPFGRVGEIFATTPGDLGVTTGMAFVGGELYGVSDAGFFYKIDIATGQASNVVSRGQSFSGLTEGPQNLEGGRFANILFAVTSAGNILALDIAGNLQAEFSGGATSASMGTTSVGIAFSPLDFNLWHPTKQRGADAGHGINTTFDGSRSMQVAGGASFYFGFESWAPEPAYFEYDINAQYGIQTELVHQELTSNPIFGAGNNYDLPGGAFGSLQTNSFSLADYDFADKPTVYFNYYLETEDTQLGQRYARHARMLISPDGGATWELLATNNSVRSLTAELPLFPSASVTASTDPRQQVQELFDNTGGWRQTRVDLSNYAGSSDVRIRFDFSTAGALVDQPGDPSRFGNLSKATRGLANNFEGFYVDDIIIGFAERGEMVTAAPAESTFFTLPPNPNPSDPSQILVGNYQLEIRRGTEYAQTKSGTGPDIIHFQTFDTNDRLVGELRRLGDSNQHRDQGQILLANNRIDQSLEFGIFVDAGARDADDSLTRPGGVRQLPTVNNQRLVTGVKIENNIVSNFGVGGILYSGDPNLGTDPLAPTPFGRIMNNTVYGGDAARGTGIIVTENASPTILNNIVSNTVNGVFIDASSRTTVVGANLFSRNISNGVIGDNAIVLQPTDPLFVDAANDNFYLAANARAVDSSLNLIADRPTFVAVNSPLGIPQSPILAPDRDLFGQLRIDDPSQDPPPGLGSNIFKDRGAVERADFLGPFIQLLSPLDNDTTGVDLNPDTTEVLVDELLNDEIRILISDVGIGIDESSITSTAVTVDFDGRPLVSGAEYTFIYLSNERTIVLRDLPANDVGRSTYEIQFDNTPGGIGDLAGNLLSPNQLSGETMFTVVVGLQPEAFDDRETVDEDGVVFIDVLSNDQSFGAPLNPNSIQITTLPSSGLATVVNGQIRYQPSEDYVGGDSIEYLVFDDDGRLSNSATVSITVKPVNDAPVISTVQMDALESDDPEWHRAHELRCARTGNGHRRVRVANAPCHFH